MTAPVPQTALTPDAHRLENFNPQWAHSVDATQRCNQATSMSRCHCCCNRDDHGSPATRGGRTVGLGATIVAKNDCVPPPPWLPSTRRRHRPSCFHLPSLFSSLLRSLINCHSTTPLLPVIAVAQSPQLPLPPPPSCRDHNASSRRQHWSGQGHVHCPEYQHRCQIIIFVVVGSGRLATRCGCRHVVQRHQRHDRASIKAHLALLLCRQ